MLKVTKIGRLYFRDIVVSVNMLEAKLWFTQINSFFFFFHNLILVCDLCDLHYWSHLYWSFTLWIRSQYYILYNHCYRDGKQLQIWN